MEERASDEEETRAVGKRPGYIMRRRKTKRGEGLKEDKRVRRGQRKKIVVKKIS